MNSIKFSHSRTGTLEWGYEFSTVTALPAILALDRTAKFDNEAFKTVLATDEAGIHKACGVAHDLAAEVSDWISTINLLAIKHVEAFADFDENNKPEKHDAILARKAFATIESIRELHEILHAFVAISMDAKPGLAGVPHAGA